MKCDTDQPAGRAELRLRDRSAIEQLLSCNDLFLVEAVRQGIIRGVENRLLTATTCADLGGSSVEITLGATARSDPRSGATTLLRWRRRAAVGEARDVIVHFRTTGVAKAIVSRHSRASPQRRRCRRPRLAGDPRRLGPGEFTADLDGNGTVDGADLPPCSGTGATVTADPDRRCGQGRRTDRCAPFVQRRATNSASRSQPRTMSSSLAAKLSRQQFAAVGPKSPWATATFASRAGRAEAQGVLDQ